MKAFVLIKVEAGKTSKVLAGLRKQRNVREAFACFGPADVIAFVEAVNEQALGQFMFKKIHSVQGVVGTDTHIVFEA